MMTKLDFLNMIEDYKHGHITAEAMLTAVDYLFNSQHDGKPIVSLSLPLSEDDIHSAADEWVFETNGMRWSNNDNTAGDNFGSFVAGAKYVLQQLGGNAS